MYLAADRLNISPREITHGDAPYQVAVVRKQHRWWLARVCSLLTVATLAQFIGQSVWALVLVLLAARDGWEWRLVGGKLPWSTVDLANTSAWFKYKFDMEEQERAKAEAKAQASR